MYPVVKDFAAGPAGTKTNLGQQPNQDGQNISDDDRPEYLPRSVDELFQRSDVLTIIARFVDGSLRDEGSVGQPRIIQKPPKALQANRSIPDVLVAVKFGTASAFGIVAVPDLHSLKPNSLVQVLQSLIDAIFADDVIDRKSTRLNSSH